MSIWRHVRLAGAVACIIAAIMGSVQLSFIGLMIMAVGIVGGVDATERRVDALEKKGADNDETEA